MCEAVIAMARRAIEGAIHHEKACRWLAQYPAEVKVYLDHARQQRGRIEGNSELHCVVRDELTQYIQLFESALLLSQE